MKAHRLFQAALALIGACAGAYKLQAQDYGLYKFDVKTCLAMYTGDMRDVNQKNHAFGFGLQVRRELFGPNNAISLEVTWENVPSMHHDIIDYAKHTGPTDHTKGILDLSPYWSYEDRKEQARGFSALLGYYSKMPTGFGSELLNQIMGNLEWFAGLRLDRYQVYSEFKWSLRNQNGVIVQPPPASAPTTAPAFYHNGDGSYGGFHLEGAAIVPGLFAGIKHTFNETISFELAARYL